ncbi:single-strand binding protein [Cohaesibacter sp. ES.047]|uniref:single-stranded DNA-binding protein n=1 Tax=Cohaesibacter sp. ES.047 TaxID=1798205 RepID=UPI000BB8A754|nr:single-stranded DNA-binding protein [Cohaesibacter sp. ES.047]SNY93379.1 single-strand binding protein [Cohaesibacter sp. ES.047]
MAGSLNQVELIGNLGADPDIRTFPDGGKVATLSIATSETWRDRSSGEVRERTEWHRVNIRNSGLVGVVERFLAKGGKVYISGQLETRKWQDQNGQDRYSTEVVVKGYSGKLLLLGGNNSQGGHPDNNASGSRSGGQVGGFQSQPQTGGHFRDEMDDDIPF